MRLSPNSRPALILRHPGRFIWGVVKAFRANQGFLLAGAVAYYALLSLVPLIILAGIVLSQLIDPAELLEALSRYLEWLVPGQSKALVDEIGSFLAHGNIGWLLFFTMLFFSSLAFTVLENAMSVIFHHRVAIVRRRYLVSAMMPYLYILSLGIGFLLVAFVAGSFQAIGDRSLHIFGMQWSLHGVSGALLYLLGLVGEIAVLTSIYLVMPVGRLRLRHALVGGVTAALLWEITRHVLAWYLSTLSQVSVVYGSLTTAIVVLLSLEIGATLLLFGAQVISEFERFGRAETTEANANQNPSPLSTE